MYPNQPPQAPQTPQSLPPTPDPNPGSFQSGPTLPTDYLNQIAPQAPKKSLFTFGIRQLVMVGVALIVLVIILSSVAGSIASGKKSPLEHLAARLSATQTIVTGAQENLDSDNLRSANSNLSLYMTNVNRDIAAPLLTEGVDVTNLDKSVVAAESTTAMAARLNDARLNAVYDSHYATEMTYQLSNILTLMSQIYNSTSSATLKTFLNTAYNNLKPIEQTFSQFTTQSTTY
jgi:hypothetical protein